MHKTTGDIEQQSETTTAAEPLQPVSIDNSIIAEGPQTW
jgi:hypothetical protein